ncbi:MAG: succinylglutamate desuccinylase/aspartoacylase family protein [Gaiellaceae bacterium]
MSHPVACTIALGADGKQVGELRLLRGTGEGDVVRIPIATIANGSGPTVLVSGGTHGDEYEGQIAARRLVAEVEPAQLFGRLILIPTISTEAAQGHSRFWPSGANFNRSFPGRVDGSPDEVLAHFFTTVLFPLVDMIIEMHSGGSGSWIVPCSHMCAVDDPPQRRAMLEAMEAWGSDIHFLYTAGDNYFPTIAQTQGKTIVTTELGGSGLIPRFVHELAWSGLTNVLRRFGVLDGVVVTRASLGLPAARIYDARGADETVTELGSGLMDQTRAPVSGIAEALVMPGETVERGQPLARIWPFDALSQPPLDVPAERSGLVLGMRARAFVMQGDGFAFVGAPITREALLAEVGA